MAKLQHDIDWSLIQCFLAVVDGGSLSAAARALGRSQPTLGRQIQALETKLDAQLFERHARGFRLSNAGDDLLPMARQMSEAMNALSLSVAGQSQKLEGTVRITASVFAAHYVLPPIIARIRAEEPSISLVLVPTDRPENLLYREADIAVRMYRPTQIDIVTRHVTSIEMGIFAAKSYLERVGWPKSLEEALELDLIGFDTSDLIIRTMREMGWPAKVDDFAVRSDGHSVCWEMVRAGCGVGFSQISVGRTDPVVAELDFDLQIPPLEVWLAAHQVIRQTPRIRRVWDLLADRLQRSQQ